MGKKTEKAFSNWRGGGLYLRFPNGNELSTTFASGSYSDNHSNSSYDSWHSLAKPVQSNTVEIMILTCPDKLRTRIHKKYSGDSDNSVIGYLGMKEWLEIVNLLAKSNVRNAPKTLQNIRNN